MYRLDILLNCSTTARSFLLIRLPTPLIVKQNYSKNLFSSQGPSPSPTMSAGSFTRRFPSQQTFAATTKQPLSHNKYRPTAEYRISLAQAQSTKRKRASAAIAEEQQNLTYALAAYTASNGPECQSQISPQVCTSPSNQTSTSFADLFARPSTATFLKNSTVSDAGLSATNSDSVTSRYKSWQQSRRSARSYTDMHYDELLCNANHLTSLPSPGDHADGEVFHSSSLHAIKNQPANYRHLYYGRGMPQGCPSIARTAKRERLDEVRLREEHHNGEFGLRRWFAENGTGSLPGYRDDVFFDGPSSLSNSNSQSNLSKRPSEQSPRQRQSSRWTGSTLSWTNAYSEHLSVNDLAATIEASGWAKQDLRTSQDYESAASCVHRDRHAASMASSDRTSTSTGRSEDRVSTGLWSSSRRSSSADSCVGDDSVPAGGINHYTAYDSSTLPCSSTREGSSIASAFSTGIETHQAFHLPSGKRLGQARVVAAMSQTHRRDDSTPLYTASSADNVAIECGKGRQDRLLSSHTEVPLVPPSSTPAIIPPDQLQRPSGPSAGALTSSLQQPLIAHQRATPTAPRRALSRHAGSHQYDSCHRVCRCLAFHFVKGCRNLPPEMTCRADSSLLESIFGPCPYSALPAGSPHQILQNPNSAPLIGDSRGDGSLSHITHRTNHAAYKDPPGRVPNSIEIGGTTFFFSCPDESSVFSSRPLTPPPHATAKAINKLDGGEALELTLTAEGNTSPSSHSPPSSEQHSPMPHPPASSSAPPPLQSNKCTPQSPSASQVSATLDADQAFSQASLSSELYDREIKHILPSPPPHISSSTQDYLMGPKSSFGDVMLPEQQKLLSGDSQRSSSLTSPSSDCSTFLAAPPLAAPILSSQASEAVGEKSADTSGFCRSLMGLQEEDADASVSLSEVEAAEIWEFLSAFVRRRRHECMKEDQFRFIINETKQRMALRDLPMVLRIGDSHWSNALAPDCWLAPRVSSKSPLGQIARSFSFRFLFPLSLIFPETDDVLLERQKPTTTPSH